MAKSAPSVSVSKTPTASHTAANKQRRANTRARLAKKNADKVEARAILRQARNIEKGIPREPIAKRGSNKQPKGTMPRVYVVAK